MVGIIIPVKLNNENDKEKFQRCLNSLCNQLYSRFITIICEDKDSIDCNDIITKYEKKLHIAFIKNETEYTGAGAARNVGLDWATNHNIESVIFLDADDILLPNGVDQLVYELNHNLANAVLNENLVLHKKVYGIDKTHLNVWITGNIYRLSFLNQYNIRFPTNFKTNEDVAFSLKIKGINEKLFYITTPVYLVCTSDDSTTSSNGKFSVISIDYIKAIYEAFDFYIKHKLELNILLPNIIACYNFYQQALIFNKYNTIELEQTICPLLLYFINNQLLTKKSILESSNLIRNLFEFENKIYIYPQNFKEWLIDLGFKQFAEEVFDESYSN